LLNTESENLFKRVKNTKYPIIRSDMPLHCEVLTHGYLAFFRSVNPQSSTIQW